MDPSIKKKITGGLGIFCSVCEKWTEILMENHVHQMTWEKNIEKLWRYKNT